MIKIFTVILSFIVISCSQNSSKISLNTNIFYQKGSYKKDRIILDKYNSNHKLKNKRIKKNHIIIQEGDTLYGISNKYNVTNQDLISKNNLKPPYILKIGQIINIPNAKYHIIVQGDSLYAISRKYNMNINRLVSLNNLSKPFNIQIGDRIRISDVNLSKKRKNVMIFKKKSSKNSIFASKRVNKFIWPIKKGIIISKFGRKDGGLYNDGINIKADFGSDVKASEDGYIAYVGNELRGYGNLIIIKHSRGWISAYAHMSKTIVTNGSKIKKGDIIGNVGDSGNVLDSQLYFAIRKGREAVNPEIYLKNNE